MEPDNTSLDVFTDAQLVTLAEAIAQYVVIRQDKTQQAQELIDILYPVFVARNMEDVDITVDVPSFVLEEVEDAE